MSHEQFIEELLHAPDTASRRVLLDTHFESINLEVVRDLKDQADRMERDDARGALELSQTALEIADRLDSDEARGLAYWMEANAHDLLAEIDPAGQCYERAAGYFKKAGKELEAACTSRGLMSVLIKKGDYQQVQQVADSVYEVFRQQGDIHSLSIIEMNLGVMRFQQGQYSVARENFQRAIDLCRSAGDELYMAMNQINLANNIIMLDDFSGAELLHEQARPVFEKADLRAVAGSVEHDLALLKVAQGNYSEAFRTFEHARDTFTELADQANIAMTDLEESDVYLDLNLPQEALVLAERAGTIFGKISMPFEQARAKINQAVALARLAQNDKAISLLEGARALMATKGNEAWIAHCDLQLAEITGQDASKLEKAIRLAGQAREAYRILGMRTKEAYAGIVAARLSAEAHEWESAMVRLDDSKAVIQGVPAPWLDRLIEAGYGRIFEGMGRLDAAIEHYQKAAVITEEMTSALPAEEHRTAFIADKLEPFEVLVRLYSVRDPAAAFSWAEHAKSRALVDLLAAGIQPRLHIENEADAQIAQRLETLREELNWLYTRLSRGAAPGESGAPAAGPETWEKIQAREKEATSLWRDLQGRHPQTASILRPYTASTAEIQADLPEHSALIEYFIAAEKVTIFVLTGEKIRVYPEIASMADILPRLEALAFQFTKFQFGPAYVQRHQQLLLKGIQEILAELGQMLVQPVLQDLDSVSSLFVVPHGPLHSIPIHALRIDGHYLIEDYVLAYAPSAAVLTLCREKSLKDEASLRFQGKPLLVGVADERATHVTEEISSLAAMLKEADILQGEQATLDQLHRSAKTCGLLHIAAHGLFRPEAPLLSSIRLADGWMAVQDIYDLQLQASLVALSACETGLGHDAGGDDLVGLVRGFLYAGARSLLVSLWMVDDESMTLLMKEFYTHWLAGASKGEALRQAQLTLMKNYENPFYWAPLVLVGDER